MTKKYVTKDSGKRQEFETGAKRDASEGKPRFDLVPTVPLRRVADLYARGAEKYGEGNYEKGMPMTRVYASLFRHLIQWREGEPTEDHMAAVAWNAFAIMLYEEKIAKGELPPELDDRNT